MQAPARTILASLAVAASLAACAGDTLAPRTAPEAGAILLSHSPAHHGADASAAIVTATPDYTGLDGATAEARGGTLYLSTDASGALPRFPDDYLATVAVFGHAWVDLDTGRGIVAVIHPVIGRDSRQNPDGWHTHPVRLTSGTKPAGASDFCIVEIGASQGGISLQRDVLRVHMAGRWAGVPADQLDVAASFIVVADTGCAATGLGVSVLDTHAL
jgi:hypothetical protein